MSSHNHYGQVVLDVVGVAGSVAEVLVVVAVVVEVLGAERCYKWDPAKWPAVVFVRCQCVCV